MLGSIKSSPAWVWGARGKLPVAGDYVSLGADSSLLKAFSGWVEKGFSTLANKPISSSSWRFWAKGTKREDLVCGLLRDSADSLGRPYPFLVLGTGTLPGWEERWELLPQAFHDHWNRMEYLSTRRVQNLGDLEGDLNMLGLPVLPQSSRPSAPVSLRLPEGERAYLDERRALFIPLKSSEHEDSVETLVQWHAFFKARLDHPPTTVFIGGKVDVPYLVVFQRSLLSGDFNRLWTVEQ